MNEQQMDPPHWPKCWHFGIKAEVVVRGEAAPPVRIDIGSMLTYNKGHLTYRCVCGDTIVRGEPGERIQEVREWVRLHAPARGRSRSRQMNEEQYLLTMLMEECAEIAHRASKAIRFGIAEVQPGQGLTNAQRIQAELYDLDAVVLRLRARSLLPFIDHTEALKAVNNKQAKIDKYMEYSKRLGQLRPESSFSGRMGAEFGPD